MNSPDLFSQTPGLFTADGMVGLIFLIISMV